MSQVRQETLESKITFVIDLAPLCTRFISRLSHNCCYKPYSDQSLQYLHPKMPAAQSSSHNRLSFIMTFFVFHLLLESRRMIQSQMALVLRTNNETFEQSPQQVCSFHSFILHIHSLDDYYFLIFNASPRLCYQSHRLICGHVGRLQV